MLSVSQQCPDSRLKAISADQRALLRSGNMSNTISLSAIVSPSSTYPGSRNVVVNMWDWDVVVSWNDGADWLASWPDGEKSPLNCGEGGSGQG